MEKKSVPPAAAGPTAGKTEDTQTRASRHRFIEGETKIVRLDEILRQRDQNAAQTQPVSTASDSGEKTQMVSLDMLRRGQKASSPVPPAALPPTHLTTGERELLARTEPSANTVMVRREDLFARAKSSTPAAAAQPPQKAPAAAASPPRAAPPPQALVEEHTPNNALGNAEASAPPLLPTVRPASQEVTGKIELPKASPAPAASGKVEALLKESVEALLPTPAKLPPAAKAVPLPAAAASVPEARAVAAPATGKRTVLNQVTVFFSCKGGAGATALAINTGHGAARASLNSCMVDMDLQLGDALAASGLPPQFGLAQMCQAFADGAGIGKNTLPRHASGLNIISQVGNLNDLDKVTPDAVSQMLIGLRQNFDAIVIDGVRDFSDNALAVLDGADKVVVVIVQEVLAVRRARWVFGILRSLGFDAQDITVIVNRYTPDSDISLASLNTMFESAPLVPILRDAAVVTQSLDRGVSLSDLAPQHPVTQGVAKLGDYLLYGGEHPDAALLQPLAADNKASLWQRMFRRGSHA